MALALRYIDPTNATIPPSSPPGEIINTLVSSFKPLYQLLIVTCVWSAMLIPLFVLLLFSSNAETRRKPVFIANMISIVIGLILAGVCIALIVGFWNSPPAHFPDNMLAIRVAQSATSYKYTAIPDV
jgi:hypothetical protein